GRIHRGGRAAVGHRRGLAWRGSRQLGGQLGETMPPSYPAPYLARFLVPRLPFFYGWVVLGCVCLAGFARQGPAVAVLSVFVVPMTDAFGWSRMEIGGAG